MKNLTKVIKIVFIYTSLFVAYCAIGVGQGNFALRDTLNIILYDMHSSGTVNGTWEKWYGAPMLAPVKETAFF